MLQNLKIVLVLFFSIKQMLEDIERETQHPDYETRGLGVSVLVIMTHGAKTEVYGKDGRPVKLTDIYDLMSPYRFQSMARKPKIIILQSCAGGECLLLLFLI